MAPLESPTKELDEKYVESIVKFVSEIQNGKLQGSINIASATVNLLEQIINDSQNTTAFSLVCVVRAAGRRVCRSAPHALVCGNMVRRVLRAIRDEQRPLNAQRGCVSGAGESLQRLVQAAPARRHTLAEHNHALREPLREHIAELRLELESSTSAICATARAHVHCGEQVVAGGCSALLETFLLNCRPHRVIVAETADDIRQTHAMAGRLSAAGLAVTVISNASVFAVMSRVNKVVLCGRGTLAGGAVLGAGGTAAIALAAKQHAVPVIALSPLHKLSPLHACDPRHLNSLVAPSATNYGMSCHGSVHEFAPRYDLIPPEHITLFITNLGGSSPSYIYRLLSELYDPLDHQL